MKRILVLIFLLTFFSFTYAQIHITGRVFDQKGEAVIGAFITVDSTKLYTLTDNFGYFFMTAPGKNYLTLIISHVSYKTRKLKISGLKDTNLIIVLASRQYDISPVEIQATRKIVNTQNLSVFNVPLTRLSQSPTILGVKDIFKSVQILPGIQPGPEATSQLNIRGGNPDQNLILIDDMPIFYSSHIYGFLSTFNSEAIKDMKIYRGAIPAQYNDFGSAVIDLTMKDGSLNSRKITLSIDPLSASTSYDGYLLKNKISSTFFLRRSLWDLFLLLGGKTQGAFLNYNFYDFNSKFRLKINPNNSLYISLFSGRDGLTYKSDNKSDEIPDSNSLFYMHNQTKRFGNKAVSIRWFSRISKKLISISNLIYSHYHSSDLDLYREYNIYNKKNEFANNQDINLNYLKLKNKTTWFLGNSLNINFGFNLYKTYYNFDKQSTFFSNMYDNTINQNDSLYIINSAYNIDLFSQINLNYKFITSYAGILYNLYYTDSILYTYPEPRVKLGLRLSKSLSMQLGYCISHQYYHQIATAAINTPDNIYFPSNNLILPEKVKIYDIDFAFTIDRDLFSLAFYYKTMDNMLRIAPGTQYLSLKQNLMDKIIIGTGYSYGIEFLVHKSIGKADLLLSYTFSRSFRQFPDINAGKPFPYKFDRPHILNISLNYKVNAKLNLSALWVFYSGFWITLPEQIYPQGFANVNVGVHPVTYYSNINNVRTPAYHRLDIALNYHHPGRHSYWSIGVYNLYNRLNPVYLEPTNDGRLRGIALFPIMPFINYRLELGTK